ncbi:30S ribosomal protein S8 [Candidatus Phytoplasma melaleucae]|uniref:Small ribosomal subunit protein uS8 n=1 Tax=Candidatus Phytoplasma melaleucae TaxID=2982630 RepID=A0ABT9DE46_9MOLU|nr:30S ribosomal protein S8 ['Melaleuca sp.' phytoplasma]MDO8168113.1 30S ribosomal protein S8 ['Melaleuca sp.' phytoplasma]MDV3205259.1 30S ribosomal protein S8 [Weeping tea tree witches'-broom phytoplasma]
MVMTDPIADLLTRIRNANAMRYEKVLVPISNLKIQILEIMKKEGFIRNFLLDSNKKNIIIQLKYDLITKECAIKGLRRVSQYVTVRNIPQVFNGFGVALISTSKGILTNYEALSSRIGGQVLALIW